MAVSTLLGLELMSTARAVCTLRPGRQDRWGAEVHTLWVMWADQDLGGW